MQNIRLRSPIRNLNFAADSGRATSKILLRGSNPCYCGTLRSASRRQEWRVVTGRASD